MARGPAPGTPKPPSSGRKVGSLDKQKRQLINDKLAGDILTVYKQLGGVAWLLEWAKQPGNGAEFIRQCLSRLLPPMPRDGADVQVNTQVNLGDTSDFEAARRIAYTLAKAVLPDPSLLPVHDDLPVMSPQQACRVPEPEFVAPISAPVDYPAPHGGPEYQQWVDGLAMPEEARADAALAQQGHLNLKEQGRSVLPDPPPERGRRTRR